MNRRNFLKKIGLGAAALPVAVLTSKLPVVTSGFSHIDDGRKLPEFTTTISDGTERGVTYHRVGDTVWVSGEATIEEMVTHELFELSYSSL